MRGSARRLAGEAAGARPGGAGPRARLRPRLILLALASAGAASGRLADASTTAPTGPSALLGRTPELALVVPPTEPSVLDRRLRAPPISELPELACDLVRLRAEYDIPIEINSQVVKAIRRFQSPDQRPTFVRWVSRSHRWAPRFRAILREQGVPGDLVYLAMVESGFSPHAQSPVGAVGPWQLLAATARQLGLRHDRWVDERRDPEKAARAAARFLRSLHARTGDWPLAWAAYNAGPTRVARAMRRGLAGFWEMERRRALPGETRGYVPRILAAAIIARHPEAFGFAADELAPEAWVDYEWVLVARTTPLARLAAAAGVTPRLLRELNPELRRARTPPRPYLLKIPRASAARFAERWPGARAPEAQVR